MKLVVFLSLILSFSVLSEQTHDNRDLTHLTNRFCLGIGIWSTQIQSNHKRIF